MKKRKSRIRKGSKASPHVKEGKSKAGKGMEITDDVIKNITGAYKEFLDEDKYYDLVEPFELFHNGILIQLFSCVPFPEAEDADLIGEDFEDYKNPEKKIITSIAKVLKVGPDVEVSKNRPLERGDIITLSDYGTASIINPRYEVFQSAKEMNTTNAKIEGITPDKVINNIGMEHRNVFYPNKLDVRSQFKDNFIFHKTSPAIMTRVKDPMKLLEIALDGLA